MWESGWNPNSNGTVPISLSNIDLLTKDTQDTVIKEQEQLNASNLSKSAQINITI